MKSFELKVFSSAAFLERVIRIYEAYISIQHHLYRAFLDLELPGKVHLLFLLFLILLSLTLSLVLIFFTLVSTFAAVHYGGDD